MNTETKHTPGPWCLRDRGGNVCIAGVDLDLGTSFVAYCRYDGKPLNARQKANARLIAAAPELLQVVEDVANWIAKGRSLDEIMPTLRITARAAIAKATGAR